MSQPTYWEVTDKDIKTKLKVWYDNAIKGREEASTLAKKHGAHTWIITGVTEQVAGFIFKDPSQVDKKLLREHKKCHNGWKPRASTKAGKELLKQMQAIDLGDKFELCNIISMKTFNGLAFRSPGIAIYGKRCILTVPSDVKPKGCYRISDLDYEAIKKRHISAKKAAKTRKKNQTSIAKTKSK